MEPIRMDTPLCDPTGVPGDLVTGAPALPLLIEPDTQPLVTADNGEQLMSVTGLNVDGLPAYYEHGLPHSILFVLARETVVARLHQAAALLPAGFGLTALDAWRPLALQNLLYQAAYSDPELPPGFVSEPSTDPATPPPHLTGGTVDLTLSWHGQPLALGSKYDEFLPIAHTAAFENTPGLIRDLRRTLVHIMRSVGFVAYRDEWWHFEYGTRRWAAITDQAPLYRAANMPGAGVNQGRRITIQAPKVTVPVLGAAWDCISPALR